MGKENVPNRHQTARAVSIFLGVLGVPLKEGMSLQGTQVFCCSIALPLGKRPSLPHPCSPMGMLGSPDPEVGV